jgi:hypothetical protein
MIIENSPRSKVQLPGCGVAMAANSAAVGS